MLFAENRNYQRPSLSRDCFIQNYLMIQIDQDYLVIQLRLFEILIVVLTKWLL